MPQNQTKAQTLPRWLKDNLGPKSLAPLTGTDMRCLLAAVMIIELYSYCTQPEILQAFVQVLQPMQRKCHRFAYHAIAHCMNWEDRERLWTMAGLAPIEDPGICNYEPGGKNRQ